MAFHIGRTLTLVLCAHRFTGSQAREAFFEVDAEPFLGKVVASRTCVHEGIEAALRNSTMDKDADVHDRLAEVQGQLRPIFDVLPRNEYGRLGSIGVRYLLHRHFLHSRAWLVRGLAPDGEPWSASFPVAVLQAGAPEDVRVIVANHLKGRGLSLRETAVLATMLENQARDDAKDRLDRVWQAHGLEHHGVVTPRFMAELLEDHALTYMAPDELPLGNMSLSRIARARARMVDEYTGWKQIREFLRKTADDVRGGAEAIDFDMASRMAVRSVERFGQAQEQDCKEMKRKLVAVESARPGRVDLRDFYRLAIEGNYWEFSDGVAYMRETGVLDETDPGAPSVVIANYMNNPMNQLANNSLFAVACIDECEDLLSHIERHVGAPKAAVEELEEIVVRLPSSSQGVQSAMPEHLLEHLKEVAAVHGGEVPLHGRLFALWMHHAYPRECPYPHPAGTKRLSWPQEFEARTGLPSAEDEAVMREIVAATRPQAAAAPLPWNLEEELLEVPPGRFTLSAGKVPFLLGAVAAAALLGVAVSSAR